MLQGKVCILGASAVGKTATFDRLCGREWESDYRTTVGVAFEAISLMIDHTEVTFNLWDTEGSDDLREFQEEWIDGSGGYILVIDGTRVGTLKEAYDLNKTAIDRVGKAIPFVAMVNKCDLDNQFEVNETDFAKLKQQGWEVFKTSAKTGEGVQEAVDALAKKMIDAVNSTK